MRGFPLAAMFREVAERQLEEAERHLDAAAQDLRLLIDGRERSGTFKPSTDPVTVLVQSAQQVQLCKTVLDMDDEAKREVA